MPQTMESDWVHPDLFDREQAAPPAELLLELAIRDRDTIAELCAKPPGAPRDDFARNALRIGVLALRQARGALDADLIRRESQQMLALLAGQLAGHAQRIEQQLSVSLKEYFDPQSGRFHERVERLVRQDGELESLLRRQIGGEDSELCRTLVAHLGENSPLMKVLAPDESQGLLKALRDVVDVQLADQRDRVLREFSLDNKEGALARLVAELGANQGALHARLNEKLEEVVKEFSLNEENSALSRLVRNVTDAQRTISREFSLDNEQSAFSRLKVMLDQTSQAIDRSLTLDDKNSPLARLRNELLELHEKHAKSYGQFQEEVKMALATIAARREEQQRSTRHGLVFEDAVAEVLCHLSQEKGDCFARTGNETGLIKNCKIGDFVVEIGPDCIAAGARIAVEAKEQAGYTLAAARQEIDKARENRQAQVGLFVFSQRSAPADATSFARFGNDVFVIWDAEDPASDLCLRVGLELSRALCVRASQQRLAQAVDFTSIDAAILEIEKRAQSLDQVSSWADTIVKRGEDIREHVRKARNSLDRQLETLCEKIASLKETIGGAETG